MHAEAHAREIRTLNQRLVLPVMIVIGTFLLDGVTVIDASCCASIKSGGDSSSLLLILDILRP